MPILENLGRVMASESILPTLDQAVSEEPASALMLMLSADLRWRRGEWEKAIALAERVLEHKPRHFHALAIMASSYGHLERWTDAYPYARNLLLAKPPGWFGAKLLYAMMGITNLVTAKGRETYRRTMRRCDEEANCDREHLRFARELVARHEDANGAIAV
jgi:tetratricopeptide (TPR) repeat protein